MATVTHRWGMVLDRPRSLYTAESYYAEVTDGIEEVLRGSAVILFLHQVSSMEEEVATYERWARERFVDGVIIVDLLDDDPRPALLERLGLRTLYAGADTPPSGASALTSENAEWTRSVLTPLVQAGHRRIARVSGPARLAHTRVRSDAARSFAIEHDVELTTLEGDYSAASGREATLALLQRDPRPTAIIYDNDAMVLAGIATAREMGVSVPEQLSVAVWDDSLSCRLAHPPVAALTDNSHELGRLIAQALLRMDDGEAPVRLPHPQRQWLARASVAPVGAAVRTALSASPSRGADRPR
ncbi:LacI family DNA-binding transcriptional regulator [Actinomyces urogenitalis]|uniref:LacI family DNA-binding transcriptional regulator n=1 Tax=Actinomyces urogenitalis TaxID=103621 RepID=UPI00189781D7|nr:substrate-binding domain-containing protein [Actinomyces urogenitalis]MDU6152502.1 substrate-binding domain-containing protein [Actinomyces urogenitalis]